MGPAQKVGLRQAIRAELRRSGPYLAAMLLVVALLIWLILKFSKG